AGILGVGFDELKQRDRRRRRALRLQLGAIAVALLAGFLALGAQGERRRTEQKIEREIAEARALTASGSDDQAAALLADAYASGADSAADRLLVAGALSHFDVSVVAQLGSDTAGIATATFLGDGSRVLTAGPGTDAVVWNASDG